MGNISQFKIQGSGPQDNAIPTPRKHLKISATKAERFENIEVPCDRDSDAIKIASITCTTDTYIR